MQSATKLSKASYDQETTARGQVPYIAHLLGIASLVLGCQRFRLVIHLDQGVNCLSGPKRLGKLRVLSAWIPALCSPLKRVTVLGQPAARAPAGEPNHKPRWYVWIGSVAGFIDASGNGGRLCTTGAGWPPGAALL